MRASAGSRANLTEGIILVVILTTNALGDSSLRIAQKSAAEGLAGNNAAIWGKQSPKNQHSGTIHRQSAHAASADGALTVGSRHSDDKPDGTLTTARRRSDDSQTAL